MANTRKRKQKQTLKEFRAWLQGVEELQPEDWAPNPEQWKLIRAKIDGIVEEKVLVEKPAPAPQPAPQMVYPPAHEPAAVLPGLPPAPPVGGIPLTDVQMTPAARQMLNPAENGGKVITPNIDTSDGNISSPFE